MVISHGKCRYCIHYQREHNEEGGITYSCKRQSLQFLAEECVLRQTTPEHTRHERIRELDKARELTSDYFEELAGLLVDEHEHINAIITDLEMRRKNILKYDEENIKEEEEIIMELKDKPCQTITVKLDEDDRKELLEKLNKIKTGEENVYRRDRRSFQAIFRELVAVLRYLEQEDDGSDETLEDMVCSLNDAINRLESYCYRHNIHTIMED